MVPPLTEPYPRSLPYRPPESADARLRPWKGLLVGSAAVVVLVLLAVAIYALSRAGRRPEAARPAAPSGGWVRDLIPTLGPARGARPQPSAPAKGAAAELGKSAEAVPPPALLLESLDRLTAAHLYQTHLNIGLLADGTESEVYTIAEAKKLLQTLTALLNRVDGQLTKVGEQGLRPDDQKSLARTRQLSALLRTQAVELKAYWDTGDREHTVEFHKAREEAWTGIRELLGLPE